MFLIYHQVNRQVLVARQSKILKLIPFSFMNTVHTLSGSVTEALEPSACHRKKEKY